MKKVKTKGIKISDEFDGADLGDSRLNKRLIKTAELLNCHPAYCINAAVEDWNTKKSIYRFFDNDKCSADKILSPHFNQTKKRMKGWDFVYSIQDTSFLEFNKHTATSGLGSIGRYGDMDNHIQGLVSHSSFAVSCTGLPLGLQSFEVWARPEEGYKNDKSEDENRIKESNKWLKHLNIAKEFYNDSSKMIYVADRESDFFEVFDCIKKLNIHAVIRSKHNRYVKGVGLNDLCRSLDKEEPAGTIIIENVKNKKKKKRSATAVVKFTNVKIEVPGNCQQRYPFGLDINVVEVKEENPPEGEKALYWRLLTTLDVSDLDSARQIIKHYKMRWNIESYFKVLKSGCKVEDCRLESADRIIRYASVMAVIAWRLYWMVHVSRLSPKAFWGLVLTKLEYHTLWVRINRKEIMDKTLPKKPPPDMHWSVRDCIRHIARLGGFNGRKSDGEPGMISIWTGWMQIQAMVEVTVALL